MKFADNPPDAVSIKLLTDSGRRTTDDGQIRITIANLEPMAQMS